MQGASTVSRMLFLPDGTLLVSTWGETGQVAQDKMGLSGKILRYTADGGIPKDNPFVGKDGYRPEIYTLGHRTPESLVWHEPSKQIFESEMGPNGGDEINIIKAGNNYGWPLVSLGRSYAGPYQPGGFHAEGMTMPVVNFVPSISTTREEGGFLRRAATALQPSPPALRVTRPARSVAPARAAHQARLLAAPGSTAWKIGPPAVD